ncbi:MAG: hypothetical protein ACI4NW_11785 [Stenotrophomonas sp.]
MTTTALTIDVLSAAQVLPQLEAVVALRMGVFAGWTHPAAARPGPQRRCAHCGAA